MVVIDWDSHWVVGFTYPKQEGGWRERREERRRRVKVDLPAWLR